MSFLKSITENLIYKKDKSDTESHRKGMFFQLSMSLFLTLNILLTVIIFPHIPVADRFEYIIANIIICSLMTALIFIYKYWGHRVLLVNIMSLICTLGTYTTYYKSGGIHSPDMIWYVLVIPMWIFLVANKQSGIFWFVVSILITLFFAYAEAQGWRDFQTESKIEGTYLFANFLFAGILTMVVMYIHEHNKEKYIEEVTVAKAEIEAKSKELESKNKDITDSINYARKIQYAVLPHEENISRNIPLSFIIYKPRDIVSGDFFWFHEIDRDNYILVCADCTGHGVPGAMMTVVGSSLLNQIVVENKFSSPSAILFELDKKINETLKQEKIRSQSVQDGMDLALIKVNKAKKEFIFTSAKRPAILFRNNQMQEFKGSKFSLGGMRMGEKQFEEVHINFQEDDIIYFYTDGVTDLFGGPKGKKYSSKRFKETLQNIHQLSMPEQKQKLENTLDSWKGDLEQVDDVLIIAIRF